MTDQSPTDLADASQDAPQTPEATAGTDAPPDVVEGKEGNKEAQKYRTRLREAESQRDQLSATLETYRTREVHTLAETHGLASGADLLTGTALADLLAEDGTVDPDKVKAATVALLETHPHWGKSKPDFGGGDRGGDISAGDNPDPIARAADAIREGGRK